MRYVCEFYKVVEGLLLFFSFSLNGNRYIVKDFKYPGLKDQMRLRLSDWHREFSINLYTIILPCIRVENEVI